LNGVMGRALAKNETFLRFYKSGVNLGFRIAR
jgi:hypothetical protein